MNKFNRILHTAILSLLGLTIVFCVSCCSVSDKTNMKNNEQVIVNENDNIDYFITGLGLSYYVGDDVLIDNAQITYLNNENVWVSKKITRDMISGFDSSNWGTYTANIIIDSNHRYNFKYDVNFGNAEQIRDFIENSLFTHASYEIHRMNDETILYAFLSGGSNENGNYYYGSYNYGEVREGLVRYIKSNNKEEWYNVEKIGNTHYLFRYTKINDKCTKELVNSSFEDTYKVSRFDMLLSENDKVTIKNGFIYFEKTVETSINGIFDTYYYTYQLKGERDYFGYEYLENETWYVTNIIIKNGKGEIVKEIECISHQGVGTPTINKNVPKIFEDKTPVKILGLFEKINNEYVEFDYTNTDIGYNDRLVYAKIVCADGDERFVLLYGVNDSIENNHSEYSGRVDFDNKKVYISVAELTYESDFPFIS